MTSIALATLLLSPLLHAQSGKRLSSPEIQTLVEETRKKMMNEHRFQDRKAELQKLAKILDIEFKKGAQLFDKAYFDKTFIEVNYFVTNIGYLLTESCANSYGLVANQTQGTAKLTKADEARIAKERDYRIQLHTALCRKD